MQRLVLGQRTQREVGDRQIAVQTRQPPAQRCGGRQGFGARREQKQQGGATLAPTLPRIVQQVQGGKSAQCTLSRKAQAGPLTEGLAQAGHGFKQTNAPSFHLPGRPAVRVAVV